MRKLFTNFIDSPKSTAKGFKYSAILTVIITITGAIFSIKNPEIAKIINDNSVELVAALGTIITTIIAIFGSKKDR